MFRQAKGVATITAWTAMRSPGRIVAVAFLSAMLSGPILRAEKSVSGPALGVARISLVRGEVSVQRGDSGDSIQARANLPLVEGDYLTTGAASRAEVQLDYSNLLRLDQHSSVRLAALGHRSFLVQIERGTVSYSELRGGDADVDIETPLAAVRPQKQGRYRIEVASIDSVAITARKGRAEVTSVQGTEQLGKGKRLVIRGAGQDVAFQWARAHPEDAWDRWNEQRDRQLTQSKVYSYVNRSIYGAEDLEGHGRWVYVPRYGRCWFPSVAAGWAPYRSGRWVWLDHYGWSWVSYDAWGWAPYHYGRWFRHARHGWGWYPGSYYSRHPWRPALVAFFGYNGPRVSVGAGFGHYGWIPLAPGEPYYPWYGRRYGYGPGRRGGGNTIVVDNSVNIYNDYRNARHRNGVTLVDAGEFSLGKMQNARSLQASELRQARVVRGRVPVVPGRSSQGKLMGGSGGSVRAASRQVRFYSTGEPRRSVKRNSFSRQQQQMTEFVRSTGGSGSRTSGPAKKRSTVKGNVRGPAATSRPQGGANSRPALKPSSRRSSRSPSRSTARPARNPAGRRSAGKGTAIRSSGDSAGRPAKRPRNFDSSQSNQKTLTNRSPSRVSAPSATLPRPGSSRSVRPSSPPAPKSAPRVSTRPRGSPSSRPSVSVPRSSSTRSSSSRTSPSRKPRTPAGTSVTPRSRRSAPSVRRSPPRVSAGSSGRSSSGKSSTRSRRSSESDDRSTKKRRTGKR
ncbi:MAG: hypothetical protein OXU26_05660 [Acidobacteriota bacterium]|nr:hypothetical protein [Acidobacteriota bacterium]MDE2963375.1 hypothetical protein [Acidobacteriota bacterium]